MPSPRSKATGTKSSATAGNAAASPISDNWDEVPGLSGKTDGVASQVVTLGH